MKNSTKIEILVTFLLVVLLLIMIFGVFHKNNNSDNSEENIEIRTESTELNVDYSDEELLEEVKNYDAKITLNDSEILVDGAGVKVNNTTVTITTAGNYYITGKLSNGNIVINANQNDVVRLVLDNVDLTSLTTSPINGIKASKLIITLIDGSTNKITDSSSYTAFTDTTNQEPDSTIFTKTDLIINGTGKLEVNANYADAIASKDTLKIINSNIEINSADDGIRGKDYVAIKDATIAINSKGDGIKSTNDTDEGLGYIVINGGNITVNSEADGIQAETILNITSEANINITTIGEVESSNKEQYFEFANKEEFSQAEETSDTNSSSSKGLKAGKEITIESGNIVISSTDDSIHSNDIIIIKGGSMKLSSGDDGIHADTDIVINNGNIDVLKSYEGIESTYIEINGGTINVIASDDGINIGGGNDGSAIGGRPGENSFTTSNNSNRKLVINGGNIKVDATGDGLDSNGSIYITGGSVYVVGPTSSGNGPLDYDSECVVTGGSLVIYGSNGMWQNPTSNSTQYSITYYFSGNADDEIVIKDSSGNEIALFTTEKSYGAIVVSNSNIKHGEVYTMYRNGEEVGSITVDSIVSTYGTSNGGMNGGMMRQGGMQKDNLQIQN